MAKYALVVVPADWDLEAPLQLTEAEHARVMAEVEDDTRVILYQRAPINAVIGEGAVTLEDMIRVAEWPAQNVDKIAPGTAYLLPVRVAYQRGDSSHVRLNDVREALQDPTFPQNGETWLTIDRDAYERLREGWPPPV